MLNCNVTVFNKNEVIGRWHNERERFTTTSYM